MPAPTPTPNAFTVDSRVDHTTFGRGRVSAVDGSKLTVFFDSGDLRKIQASFVRPAPAAAPPSPANDNQPAAATPRPAPLTFVDPTAWLGTPVPKRNWYVPALIPSRTVTLLSGDGGLGKSLIALQLSIASAVGTETMGLTPSACRVVYVGAEDEEEEFHRRIDGILSAAGHTYSDLGGRFLLLPLAEQDATLAAPDRAGKMVPTDLFAGLIEKITQFRPGLIVLDTSADLFGGDEIKRSQVRQFVAMLRAVAISVDCAVLLLSHPSVAGLQSGSGTSGSTAWNNSVRSRLYLTSPTGEDADEDSRVLTTMKANYGRKGDALKLRWHEGVFVPDDGARPNPAAALINGHVDRIFIALLSKFNRLGQNVGDTPGTNYAPAKMAGHPDAKGTGKRALAAAMQRLIEAGTIKIVWDGSPSRKRKRLIVTEEDFGPDG